MSTPCVRRLRSHHGPHRPLPRRTPAAEAALACRLLEDGDDPNAWTVRYLWASDAERPVFAVVLEADGISRAFTLAPEAGGYEVLGVE